MKKRFLFALVGLSALIVIPVAGCSNSSANSTQTGPTLKTKKLVNGTITVKTDDWFAARRLLYYDIPFSITSSMTNPSVQGIFTVAPGSGGSQNNVFAFVFDDSSFNDWINGNQVIPRLYDSGLVPIANIKVSITAPGNYHLVFYNVFAVSPFNGATVGQSKQQVIATVNLTWYQ